MAKQIYSAFSHVFRPDNNIGDVSEFEYAVRKGTVLVPRIIEDVPLGRYIESSLDEQTPQLESIGEANCALGLEIETPGLLETTYWVKSLANSDRPKANEVKIDVSMFALNFKDLMNAMGQLEGLSAMLIEATGTVTEVGHEARQMFKIGDRVCAFGYDGLTTTSNVDHHLVQRIPDGMSLEHATAIQVSYTTALYALRDIAQLQKGESILIHAGAGALGQASIALAMYMNAGEIFVTVGNPEKKLLVMNNFGISEENIFSSRDLSFGAGIRRRTRGRGVDVVLNSLSGDATRESQRCLAPFGRFVELGKKDLLTNARMEMQAFEKNAVFAAVDLAMVAEAQPWKYRELRETVFDLVHSGKVQTLHPIVVKPISELEDAFRTMQAGKHMGKILLQVDRKSQVRVRITNEKLKVQN